MTEGLAYESFLLCIIIIMFALTALVLLGIFSVCFWIINRIIQIIKGKRRNFFD